MRDRALPVHVRILKIFSEGGEGPAFRPGWIQIHTLENRRGSGPPLPTHSAHDVDDNIGIGIVHFKKTERGRASMNPQPSQAIEKEIQMRKKCARLGG